MLVSVNSFLSFVGHGEMRVKLIKLQRRMFVSESRILTAADCKRLRIAANGSRIAYIIRTMCETGIRVSELKYITVEAVACGRAEVDCKGKVRVILIPERLRRALLKYAKEQEIKSGCIFVTRSGVPINRSNIWRDMKALCAKAGVDREKVFPHNLRHLFARTFYSVERDIVSLADVLGHSNVNTTRIYTADTEKQHLCSLEKTCRVLTT